MSYVPINHSNAEATLRERKGLWIEVRDSGTGERRISMYAAPVPRSRGDRERFLNRYVPQILPGAKLRTYAGGAATFIVGQLLIRRPLWRRSARRRTSSTRRKDPGASCSWRRSGHALRRLAGDPSPALPRFPSSPQRTSCPAQRTSASRPRTCALCRGFASSGRP